MKKFKSMLLIVFALVLCFYAMPQPAAAASGSFGKSLRWNLDSAGTMTISGKGAMPDYEDVSKAPWFLQRMKIKKVTISSGVTSIGDRVFYGCENIQSVSISDSVKSIGEEAFFGAGMKQLKIPDSVTSIDEGAFTFCTNLTSIVLPKGITKISEDTFTGCRKLKTVDIPNSVKIIEEGAFYMCDSLTSVTIPRNVKTVESHVFGDSLSLKELYVYSKDCTFVREAGIPGNTPMETIYGYKGSTAESLAKKIGAKFVDIETVHTHTWSKATCKSPKKCELCGKTSGSKADHSYTNDCDATCNSCKAKRSVKHTYTNTCDASCNTCNALRAVGHTYDNSCDTACNVCKATRTAKHTHNNPCDIFCKVCNATRAATPSYRILCTKATSHMYKAVKTESGTKIMCVICQKTVSKPAA